MKFNFFGQNFLLYLVIGLYLILAPFILLPEMGMYDSKRVLQLQLFLLLAVILLVKVFRANTANKTFTLSKKVLFTIFLIAGFGLLSSLLSVFPQHALLEILIFGNLLLICLLMSGNTRHSHLVLGKFIYLVALLFAGIYLIYFLGNYIAAHMNPLVPMWPDRLGVAIRIEDTLHRGVEVVHFVNRRFFNHIQTWTLPLLVSLVVYYRSQKVYRNIILLLLCFWWVLVYASSARGTTVAFIIASFFLVILFRKRSYLYIGSSIGTAIGGWVIYFFMFKAFTYGESLPVIKTGDSARFEKWSKALELWSGSPALGVGPMHYAAIGETGYAAHPHNFYLQLLAEWGILGLFSFLTLFALYFLFFKRTFIQKNFSFIRLSPRNSAVYMGFIGAAVAALAHAGISGIFHTPMSQIWAVLIFAWFISLWNRKGSSRNSISIKKKYLSIFYFVLVAGLIYLVSLDICKLDRKHKQFREQFENANISPRFWEQGLIFKREEESTEAGPEERNFDN